MNALIPLADFWRWIANRSSTHANSLPVRLAHRTTTARILDAGQLLQCVRGTVWLTSDRRKEDIVLRAGEAYVPSRHERVVIEALEDAVLQG